MHEISEVSDSREVQAVVVKGLLSRLRFEASHRRVYPMSFREGAVSWVAARMLVHGAVDRWRYMRLTNGVSLVVPQDLPGWLARGPESARVALGAEAAGIAISLAVLDWSVRNVSGARYKSLGYLLGVLEYMAYHPEALAIHCVLTGWCSRMVPEFGPLQCALNPVPMGLPEGFVFEGLDAERRHLSLAAERCD